MAIKKKYGPNKTTHTQNIYNFVCYGCQNSNAVERRNLLTPSILHCIPTLLHQKEDISGKELPTLPYLLQQERRYSYVLYGLCIEHIITDYVHADSHVRVKIKYDALCIFDAILSMQSYNFNSTNVYYQFDMYSGTIFTDCMTLRRPFRSCSYLPTMQISWLLLDDYLTPDSDGATRECDGPEGPPVGLA